MVENGLNNLESKVDKLIELLQKVRLENKSLNKKLVLLNKENVVLSDKIKKAVTSLKNLVMQLQDELCQKK